MSAINLERLSARVAGLACLRFFPSRDDTAARLEITKQIASMAGTWERACWIIAQIIVLTNEWPGCNEIRGVFCLRFSPADGITADSALCPDGHIPDGQRVGFAAAPALAAPGRDPRDRSLPAAVRQIVAAKEMKRL